MVIAHLAYGMVSNKWNFKNVEAQGAHLYSQCLLNIYNDSNFYSSFTKMMVQHSNLSFVRKPTQQIFLKNFNKCRYENTYNAIYIRIASTRCCMLHLAKNTLTQTSTVNRKKKVTTLERGGKVQVIMQTNI